MKLMLLLARVAGIIALLAYIGLGVVPIIYNGSFSYIYNVPVSPGATCYMQAGTTPENLLSSGAACRQYTDHTAYWWANWEYPESATSRYVPIDLGVAAIGVLALVFTFVRRRRLS